MKNKKNWKATDAGNAWGSLSMSLGHHVSPCSFCFTLMNSRSNLVKCSMVMTLSPSHEASPDSFHLMEGCSSPGVSLGSSLAPSPVRSIIRLTAPRWCQGTKAMKHLQVPSAWSTLLNRPISSLIPRLNVKWWCHSLSLGRNASPGSFWLWHHGVHSCASCGLWLKDRTSNTGFDSSLRH